MTPRLLAENAAGLLFTAFVCLVAGACIYGSTLTPAAIYEKIGSGAFPMALGLLALLLAGAKAASFRRTGRTAEAGAEPVVGQSDRKALGALLIIVGYVAALAAPSVPFTLATSAFVFLLLLFLTGGGSARLVLTALAAAILFAFVVHHVFTGFFYLDI